MPKAIEWILLGAVSASAIIVGIRWHRPARTGPWLLFAASIVCVAIGDVFNAFHQDTIAELWYLVQFVLVSMSLLQLTRGGAILVDRARLLDLLAFTCSALLVVWVFVIGDSGMIGRVSATYVIGALLLVGVAARLIAAAGPRNWSAILLCVGAAGVLASDIANPLWPGPLTEIGYIVLYLAWGAAALHPSMALLTAPTPTRPSTWQGRWAALLGISVATPPLVLLIEALSGSVRDGVVIAVTAGLTLMLTITRLADSVALSSQALSRERALREASEDLVAAADLAAVDEAVRSAVGRLIPPQWVSRIVVAPDDRQLAATAPSPAESPAHSRSWWATSEPANEPGPAVPRRGSPARESTLVCPLWLEPLAVARPSGGALVLHGRHDALAVTRDALEVLAGQAALALDRISLVDAMGRRDSDLYLRAVIRNTAEIMLVIDDDQRIRYASPALLGLVGKEELPPLATLQDLVHPDDRSQVRRALGSEGDGMFYCALQGPDDHQVLVEATYRDLREDRLVQGFVVTMRRTGPRGGTEDLPHERTDELPAWVNRRSAQHKFRY